MLMRKLFVAGALCALLLAGCDLGGNGSPATTATDGGTTASSTSTDTGTSSSTTTGSTTTTASPTATPTSTIPKPTACGKNFPSGGIYGYIGDMLISYPSFGFLSYMGIRLPDNMPQGKPYPETTPTSSRGGGSNTVYAAYLFNGNPGMGDRDSGFVVTICNSSTTTSHVLRALGAQITGFTSAAGKTVDYQIGCDSAVSATVPPEGGCGGSAGAVNAFDANWPTGASTGTTVTITQASNDGGFTDLPVTLKPGETYDASIGMNYPGQPGNYTFQFGMQIDNIPLATVGANSPQILMATPVSQWSGYACYANTAWKAIVVAHPKNWYVCPG
jgi:hypothetical protein